MKLLSKCVRPVSKCENLALGLFLVPHPVLGECFWCVRVQDCDIDEGECFWCARVCRTVTLTRVSVFGVLVCAGL